MMERDARPVMDSLDGCYVSFLLPDDHRVVQLIARYEWLGTLPSVPEMSAGLFTPGRELIGVAMFGHGSGTKARLVCGSEYADKHLVLERGTCVHWAHPHAASFLIPRACKVIRDMSGHSIFTAYSDVEAGEIGTVYQACNWLYLGQMESRSRVEYLPPANNRCGLHPPRWMSEKQQRMHRKVCGHTIEQHRALGWEERPIPAKHKYVWFEGNKTERKALLKALKYPVLPYPKRQT